MMNGDNNLDGINLPRLWLLFVRIGKTYRVTSRSDDNNNHHSSKVARVKEVYKEGRRRVKLLTATSSDVYTQAARRGLSLAKHLVYMEI